MLCQNCKLKEATSHIHSVVNGVVTDMYLCHDCAAELNQSFAHDDIFGLLTSFLKSNSADPHQKITCECCGASFDEISKNGRVGCGNCYKTFIRQLEPALIRLHGRSSHVGKRVGISENNASDVTATEDKEVSRVDELKARLKEAIEKEEYEQAAYLRDEIKKEMGEQ